MKSIEKIDRNLLWAVCLTIAGVILINFITSYQHIYDLGLKYGEYGVDARLMPIGIDGMLLALSLANVFAARFQRGHWLLRFALAFGVAGTVAANGAYGAHWGLTGNLLGTWSPVALFTTVEAGLYMFRVTADVIAKQQAPRRGRPPGSRTTQRTPRRGDRGAYSEPGTEVAIPVIQGRVDPLDPFYDLRQNAA